MSANSTARCTMSFADLFARYREMGAMGPQPFDEHGILFNEVENAWTYSIDDDSQDAPVADDDGGKKERTRFKPSRAFLLTPEGDHVRVSSDEEFEELVYSPHRLGLNLGLLKHNNVCKEYYRLTSNVLRSLIVGIKEIATDEITHAWQVGFPCASQKKRFSSLFVDKLNEDATYPKLTSLHTTGEVGISKLSSLNCPAKLARREVVNIANLRRWLWDQTGHPVSYMSSASPVNENYRTDAVIEKTRSLDSQEQTTAEAQLVPEEILCEGPEQMTSTEPVDPIPHVENTEESADLSPTTRSESADDETPTQSNSSQTPLASTAEDDEASTKPSTDSESDHEPLRRRIRPINQTASANKRFSPSLRGGDDGEKPRKHNDVNSMPSRKYSVPVGCKSGEIERQVPSKEPRHTTVVARNNEAIMPTRTKSWCLVGGYVKRFQNPAKHQQHTSRKIQPPSKTQPQVPLAA